MCPHKLYFSYGSKEIEYLKSQDKILGQAIDRIGPIQREINPDLFSALIKSIVGQQISTKAQTTIWQRMQTRFTPFTPETLWSAAPEEIQACGITMRKAIYIHEIVQAIQDKKLDLAVLPHLSDEEVCQELTQLRGVGQWTAEMLLTFCLQRPDVVSYGDLAIRRGMSILYSHPGITQDLFQKYRRRYRPYGTVASLYLWAIAGGA